MSRKGRNSAVIALCWAVGGVGLVGCEEPSKDASSHPAPESSAPRRPADDAMLTGTGTRKVKVEGRSVNVSCAGTAADGKPVIVLLHGGGDELKKMAGLQKALSSHNRVCSYDRLGAGASDKPGGPQTLDSTGKVLTGVIERVSGDAPVVLGGHSLGGLIAARYAGDNADRVAGLVLMDATSPTQNADLAEAVPESATGPAAELRDQTLAVLGGKNPERLTVRDGKVRSAGDIPVEVVKHGKRYLAEVPEYGSGMERAWSKGQRKWLAVSSRSKLSTAGNSEHYIYLDQPDVAVGALRRVTSQAADRA
ncbi:alpha/beta fold hydrolase [Streptomyces reniochalinae]|uniref:Alpha/beta fold hydrolase n=1 Tax=Streptomyces reniochalinae TaxID=2250578 RepID=A0A367EDB4_9ACTN|nr:alpha/beta fold hydrolase [Streptomyces reniochalinae]RCG16051.1 alpha/beta fold hydrolase [Streptomyces reniochalinae]